MPSAVTAQQAFLYHTATGCPLSEAKAVLARMTPTLRARVLEAARTCAPPDLLVDPTERKAPTSELVRAAAVEAEKLVELEGRGRCHAIWAEQSRILKQQYGVDWYSPAEMNPGVFFD